MTRIAAVALCVMMLVPGIGQGAAAESSGARAFDRECGPCHAPGATASRMLAKRLGDGNGRLTERDDLDPDYIRTVMRRGINSMMPMSRVEVTDGDLDAIIDLLSQ